MTPQDQGDLRYLDGLITDARNNLDAAQTALATATAWVAIVIARGNENNHEGDPT